MSALSQTTGGLSALLEFVNRHPRLVIITGAGISAGSGIPTYRDDTGRWLRAEPIKHQEFLRDPARRQRYWGRSVAGWPGVRDARPNAVHLALARLERHGHLELLVTQNVDRLHQRAGSARVIDLHGRLDRVRCLQCGAVSDRELLQQRLLRANPFLHEGGARARPDGDADLDDALLARIVVPGCERCDGVLMPDVVFFGGAVPGERVDRCREAVAQADALLVTGSSLQVYSAFRFCRQATALGKPIAIVNAGSGRADELATLRLQAPAETLLPPLADALAAATPAATA
jgi:NAD-dependent SIR2 family protein deacetylase